MPSRHFFVCCVLAAVLAAVPLLGAPHAHVDHAEQSRGEQAHTHGSGVSHRHHDADAAPALPLGADEAGTFVLTANPGTLTPILAVEQFFPAPVGIVAASLAGESDVDFDAGLALSRRSEPPPGGPTPPPSRRAPPTLAV